MHGNIRDQRWDEEPLCSAVTHRGQGHGDKHSINQGRGKSSSVLPLHLCQSNLTGTAWGPWGRDLACDSQPWAALAQLDHTTKYKISVVASEACEIILFWQNVVSILAVD